MGVATVLKVGSTHMQVSMHYTIRPLAVPLAEKWGTMATYWKLGN